MERAGGGIGNRIDWITMLIFALMLVLGWLNIYASIFEEEVVGDLFEFGHLAGRQLIWIGILIPIIILIFVVDAKVFEGLSFAIYVGNMILLILVLLIGSRISGSQSWFDLGFFRFQPSEFAKFSTALYLARFLSPPIKQITDHKTWLPVLVIVGIPFLLIVAQGDPGTGLVFTAFILVLYREGMPTWLMVFFIGLALTLYWTIMVDDPLLLVAVVAAVSLLGFGLNRSFRKGSQGWLVLAAGAITIVSIMSTDFIIENLAPHRQNRIKALVNPEADPLGVGWNVLQSKIAIGAGGFSGQGYLQGLQTKLDFVPEQSTDFIFCTIGEEQGWIGSIFLIALFVALLFRVQFLAERQRSRFGRVYGYAVFAILLFHFTINVGMTIGLVPVIGIPLPFFSYGGSSLIGFTLLLVTFVKIDAERTMV